jgi:hypothetical protein
MEAICSPKHELTFHRTKMYWSLLKKLKSGVWVHERTISTERPPRVGEASANFADRVVNVTDPYGHIHAFLDRIVSY